MYVVWFSNVLLETDYMVIIMDVHKYLVIKIVQLS